MQTVQTVSPATAAHISKSRLAKLMTELEQFRIVRVLVGGTWIMLNGRWLEAYQTKILDNGDMEYLVQDEKGVNHTLLWSPETYKAIEGIECHSWF